MYNEKLYVFIFIEWFQKVKIFINIYEDQLSENIKKKSYTFSFYTNFNREWSSIIIVNIIEQCVPLVSNLPFMSEKNIIWLFRNDNRKKIYLFIDKLLKIEIMQIRKEKRS